MRPCCDGYISKRRYWHCINSHRTHIHNNKKPYINICGMLRCTSFSIINVSLFLVVLLLLLLSPYSSSSIFGKHTWPICGRTELPCPQLGCNSFRIVNIEYRYIIFKHTRDQCVALCIHYMLFIHSAYVGLFGVQQSGPSRRDRVSERVFGWRHINFLGAQTFRAIRFARSLLLYRQTPGTHSRIHNTHTD